MQSSASFKGHPIHPMLVPFPFAYLFGSTAIDLWASAAGRPRWFRTARHMNALGIASALAAAVPGIVDYLLAVPPKSSARERATSHMLANLSALALFVAARAGRDEADDAPRAWAVAAELCGAALLGAAGWMGGTLVYRNQIGVDHRYADAGKWRVEAIAPGAAGDGPVDVGAADDLGVDQMKLVHVAGRRLVLARTEGGHVAFDDRCTHSGGSLADGALACGTVQCPWHGSQFDVDTGKVKHGPAEEPIETYEVAVRDGRLWLTLESLEAPAPQRAKRAPRSAGKRS